MSTKEWCKSLFLGIFQGFMKAVERPNLLLLYAVCNVLNKYRPVRKFHIYLFFWTWLMHLTTLIIMLILLGWETCFVYQRKYLSGFPESIYSWKFLDVLSLLFAVLQNSVPDLLVFTMYTRTEQIIAHVYGVKRHF